MSKLDIVVVGAGVVGLWQALECARRGHKVTLREAASRAAAGSASRCAGAMLAPYCETGAAHSILRTLGLRSIDKWREVYPEIAVRGSLVVAEPGKERELADFAEATTGHRSVKAPEITSLEPDIAEGFSQALFYPEEAHLSPRPALAFLLVKLKAFGADLQFDAPVSEPIWMAGAASDVVIDCRGIAARDDLSELCGVRGEMAVIKSSSAILNRPIRLLGRSFPCYISPWGDGAYMVGGTVIDSENTGPVTLNSALRLLSAAKTLCPSFGDAEIIELSVGVRPTLPNCLPQIIPRGRRILVNGAYRHGFLTAPALAEMVAEHLENGGTTEGVFA